MKHNIKKAGAFLIALSCMFLQFPQRMYAEETAFETENEKNTQLQAGSDELVLDENYDGNARLVPSSGDVKSLVLLVDFPDRINAGNWTISELRENFNLSLHDVFYESSFGKMNMTTDVVDHWYTAKNSRSYYSELAAETNTNYARSILLKEAIESVDADVDFSEYDSNHDGFIDELYLLCAGNGKNMDDFWWPCGNDGIYEITADNTRVGKYVLLDERVDIFPTATHETGHSMGLTDLYDTLYPDSETFTVHDIMSDLRGDFNAYSKILLGWIEPLVISSGSSVSLRNSAEYPDAAIVYPYGDETSDQFFVIEYNGPGKRDVDLYDNCLNGGLRIWRVNKSSLSYGNRFGRTPYIENVDWQNARGYVQVNLRDRYTSLWNGENDFTPYTYPSSFFYKGEYLSDGLTASGISIKDISPNGETLTCNVVYESELSPDDFSYEFDYDIGNMLEASFRFPIETYLVGDGIHLYTDNNTEIPLSYFIESASEEQSYTKLKLSADLSGHLCEGYRLEIDAGILKNPLDIENPKITEILKAHKMYLGSVKDTNPFIYGISEAVALNGNLYNFKVENNNVIFQNISADYDVLSSKTLFQTVGKYVYLRTSIYNDSIILTVFSPDDNYRISLYKIAEDGSYEKIASWNTYIDISHRYCNGKLITARFEAEDLYDVCTLDLDTGVITAIISGVQNIHNNYGISVYVSDHYVFFKDSTESKLYKYGTDGTLLMEKEMSSIQGITDEESILAITETDDGISIITNKSYTGYSCRDSFIRQFAFDDAFNLVSDRILYESFGRSGPTDIYKTENGFFIPTTTFYKVLKKRQTTMNETFAAGLFFDSDMNYRAAVLFNVPQKGDTIKSIAEIRTDEFVIATDFQIMHVSIGDPIEPPHVHTAGEPVKEGTDPTCTEAGYYTEVIYCTECGEEISRSEIIEVPATGHDFGMPEYTWSSDHMTCTAKRICKNDASHVEEEIVNSTYEVTIPPTVSSAGQGVYTAVFENTEFVTQTETVEIPMVEVAVVPAETEGGETAPEVADAINAFDGSIVENLNTYGIDELPEEYELNSGESIVVQTYMDITILDKQGDSETGYTLTLEMTPMRRVTAVNGKEERIVSEPQVLVINDTVNVSIPVGNLFGNKTQTVYIRHIKDDKAYYYTGTLENGVVRFTNPDGFSVFEISESEYYDLVKIDPKTATCTEAGNTEYWYDRISGRYYADEEHKQQIEEGSWIIPAIGHKYGTPTYTWNGDEVTAKAVCEHDNTHVITETVTATNKVTTEPTCEKEGVRTYTATFKNSMFKTQTKTESIPAIGHQYGTPEYTWSSDNKTATAKRVCKNDPSHVDSETVKTTYKVTVQPGCETEGEGKSEAKRS